MTIPAGSKIAFVGDSRWSSVFGSTDPRDGFDYKIQGISPVKVLNYSANGQRITRIDGLEWAAASFVDLKHGLIFPHGIGEEIKLAVMMLGYNDWLTAGADGLSNYAKAWRECIHWIKQVNITPVVVSDIYTIDEEFNFNPGGHTLNNYRATAQSVAGEQGVGFIDGKTLIPQDQANYDGGVHPNAQGHSFMATNLPTLLGLPSYP